MAEKNNILEQVKEKIAAAENILVALSRDPNVDEMAAAIGLTMALDNMGKHATAIYSGATPNALEFLKPEETFEADTNSLQDFIIALNKEKADHLRYKVEGDYVRVYITPYKTTISEKDLEFSHGDFNVDLVIALNIDDVANLDAALSEYGRIMHDATAVNITTGKAGKFAELEWSDPGKSSVSEMLVELLAAMEDAKMSKEVATAFLTGIVAETDRFSNDKTAPETLTVASELMKAGADQKLIADNVELGGEKAPEAKAEPTAEPEQQSATEQLEQIITPPTEEETAMEQLRQVANDVQPPEIKPGQNPAEVVAPEMTEKEANDIPVMNFGGGDTVSIVPPSEQKQDAELPPAPEETNVPMLEEAKDETPVMGLDDIQLPPPPTPPIDTGSGPSLPAEPASAPELPQIEIKDDATLPEIETGETPAAEKPGETEGFFNIQADEDPGMFKLPNT